MIADQARFKPTVFMTVAEYNALPASDRRTIDGKQYVNRNGWHKCGFRKPLAQPAPVKVAA